MPSLLVSFYAVRVRCPIVAELTFVWLLSPVHTLMCKQVPLMSRRISTEAALVRLFSCVRPLVQDEVAPEPGLVRAISALERLLPHVRRHMACQATIACR